MTLYIFSIFILVILLVFLMLRVVLKSIDYLAFATNQSISVIIPKGAASSEVDITKLTPTQIQRQGYVKQN